MVGEGGGNCASEDYDGFNVVAIHLRINGGDISGTRIGNGSGSDGGDSGCIGSGCISSCGNDSGSSNGSSGENNAIST